jgi:hypothetical protein
LLNIFVYFDKCRIYKHVARMPKQLPTQPGINAQSCAEIGNFLRSPSGYALLAELRRQSPGRTSSIVLGITAPTPDACQHFYGRTVQYEQTMQLMEDLQLNTYTPAQD